MNQKHFDIIDVLRFFAAFWVMMFHYFSPGLSEKSLNSTVLQSLSIYGYLGVDLFFIISGFVISYSAENRTASSFFWARFFRLWPTFMICMTATAIFSAIAGLRYFDLYAYLINATMISSYLGVKPYDGVYWTLAYELFFYALIFVAIFSGIYRHKMLLTLLLATVVLAGYLATRTSEFGYFSYFLIGICLQSAEKSRRDRLYVIAFLFMSAVAIHASYERAWTLGYNGEIAALFVSVIIAVFSLATISGLKAVKIPFVRTFGMMTYPLYLLHSTIGINIIRQTSTDGKNITIILTVMCIMLFLSYFVYRFDDWIIQKHLKPSFMKSIGFVAKSGKVQSGS